MALFTLSERTSKIVDNNIAKKSKSKGRSTSTVRTGGDVLVQKILIANKTVHEYLSKHSDVLKLCQDESEFHNYLYLCAQNGIVSIDTETDGLDPMLDTIAGFSLYTRNAVAIYVPINHVSYVTNLPIPGQLSVEFLRKELTNFFDGNCFVVMHNASFDIRVIRNQLGVSNVYCDWDTYLASMCLNENEPSHALKKLHQKYVLNGEEEELKYDEIFKGIPFTKVPIETGYLYAANDPKLTLELYDFQKPYLTENDPICIESGLQDVARVFHNIEMPCVKVVADMEDTGIELDLDYNKKLQEKYHVLLDEKKQAVYNIINQYAGKIVEYRHAFPDIKLDEPINIGSPKQLAILLYDIMGCKSVDKKSPRGTGEKILQQLGLPLCDAILEYRATEKLVSTYIDKLPDCVNPNDGRIHCKFNQYGADTGRFSSSDPNLQNIPSHNKDIRKMFKATDGYIMMSSDFSQQEPRVMAMMCGDEVMLQAFREGKDFYAQIASVSFNRPLEDCLEHRPDGTVNPEGKERRFRAKSILLGILYGRGEESIAEQLNCSKQKAKKIKEDVLNAFPAIRRFDIDSKQMANDYGFVTTLWGRKRRLPDMQLPDYEFKWANGAPPSDDLLDFDSDVDETVPYNIQKKYLTKLNNCFFTQKRKVFEEANSEGVWIIDNTKKITDAERQCVNSRIQGSAADMSKLALIAVNSDKQLRDWGFRILIPIHDEILAECPKENAKQCKERFAYLMNTCAADKFTIPMSCDVECSDRWYGEEIVV